MPNAMAKARPMGRPVVQTEPDAVVKKILTTWGLRSQIADACGIRAQGVSTWKRVPPHWVHTVAEVMKMTPEQIRPDIFRTKK
jgi:hypothetical protein